MFSVLDWRVLYEMKKEIRDSKLIRTAQNFHEELQSDLTSVIKLCRIYFSPSATAEIMRKARPYFCPHDKIMETGVQFCSDYLPTIFVER